MAPRAASRRRRAGCRRQQGAVCPAAARAASPEQCHPPQRRRPRRDGDRRWRRFAAGGARSVLSGARQRPARREPAGSRSVLRPADGARGVPRARRRFADGGRPRHQHQSAAARAAVCKRVPSAGIDRHAGRSKRTRHGTQPGKREVHRRRVRSAARAEGCAAHPSAARSRRGRAVSRQRGHRTRSLAAERGRPSQRGVGARRSHLPTQRRDSVRLYGLAVAARRVAGARVRRRPDAAQRCRPANCRRRPVAARGEPVTQPRARRGAGCVRQHGRSVSAMRARRSTGSSNRSARCARCCSRCSARSSGRSA